MASKQFNSVEGFSVGNTPNGVIDANANITAAALTANGNVSFTGANVSLGSNSNVKLTGGSSGQYLQTDGTGNLSWQAVTVSTASISNGNSNVNIPAANGNIQVSVAGTANVITFASNNAFRGSYGLTGIVSQANTAPANPQPGDQWYNTFNGILFEYIDDGTSLQWVDVNGLPGVVGPIVFPGGTANAVVYLNSSGETITSSSFVFDGTNVTAPRFTSTVSTGTAPFIVTSTTQVANLNAATAGSATTATTAGTVTTSAQPNITSVGTLTSLGVSGTVTAPAFTANTGIFTGNGSGLSAIAGANVTGTVPSATSATTAGTVTTAAQPNITSVGTLTSLSVTGNVAAGNLTTTGVLSVTGTGVSSIAGNLDMTSNTIINLATPTNPSDAATKQYVDDVAQGLHTHDSCNAATSTTLATSSGGTVTYNNGTSGVGATLTTTGSYTTIDGVTLSNGMRILVKNEANTAHNGIYDRTSSTVLTRSTDFDTPAEMAGGDFTFVTAGTLYDNTGWVMVDVVTTVGTSPVEWVQFSGAGTYTAGTGLTLTGSQFSVNASQTQVTSVGTLTDLTVSGNVSIADRIIHTGDTNTAIRFPAADTFTVETSGSERMRIDSAGNMGIGTTSPNALLTVQSASVMARFLTGSATDGRIEFAYNTTDIGYINMGSSSLLDLTARSGVALAFGAGGSERMRIDASGDVGIGASNPAGWRLRVEKANSQFVSMLNTAGNGVRINMADQSWQAEIEQNAGNLLFKTGGTTERMRITSGGDVGIGTSSPVNYSGYSTLTIQNTNGGVINLRNGTATAQAEIAITPSELYVAAVSSTPLAFKTTNTERMRITSEGNVGIGTTSPGAKLEVSGTATLTADVSGLLTLGRFSAGYPWALVRPDASATGIEFRSNAGTAQLSIVQASGNVGIGTASPGYRLDVVGASTAGSVTAFAIENPSTNAASEVRQEWRAGGSSWGYITTSYNSNSPFMAFGVSAASATPTERMRLDASGNLGIGTTSPTARLTVSAGEGRVDITATNVGGRNWNLYSGGGGNVGAGAFAISEGGATQRFVIIGGGSGESMRITDTGNVGIGTTSPAARLVVSNNGSNGFEFNTSDNILQTYNRATSVYTDFNVYSLNHRIFTGSTPSERMRITSAGNVGIGTSSPAAALHVANGNIRLTNGSAFTTAGSLIREINSASGSENQFVTSAIGFNTGDFSDAGVLTFSTANNASTPTERMRISQAGNVGIGTGSPAARLDVSGSSRNRLDLSTVSPTWITTNTAANAYAGIVHDALSHRWLLSSSDAMVLNSSGNVGIGTSSPSSYGRLSVNGNIILGPLTRNQATTQSVGVWTTGDPADDARANIGFTTVAGAASSSSFITFATNSYGVSGGERMRIDSSGNVGIGTSSPNAILELNRNFAGEIGAFIQNSNAGGYVAVRLGNSDRGTNGDHLIYGSSTLGLRSKTGAAITFEPAGTERMRITAAGNVGIGTSSPATTLSVAGTITVTDGLLDLSPGYSIRWGGAASGIYSGSGTNDMVFTVGSAERFRVNGSSGNFGIGTSNPATLLHVSSSGVTTARVQSTGAGQQAVFSAVSVGGSGTFQVDQAGNMVLRTDQASMFIDNFGAGGSINFRTGGGTTRLSISNTGSITSSDLADAVGYKGLPVNAQGSGYTLVMADQGRMVTITGGVTIPANGSVAFPVGTSIVIYNNSSSNQTISITTDTLRLAGTATTGSRTLAQRGFATCIKVAATEWVVTGNVT